MATEREPFDGFFDRDFDNYLPDKRKKSDFNDERLKVKHKLHSLGELLCEPLKQSGLELDFKTSLSHPYTYNKFSVDSQWVYFARKEKDRRALKKLFGEFLGKDLDMHYSHVILVVEINLEGIIIALKVHQHAWWDGQNVKNHCRDRNECEKLCRELNQLNGFIWSIHNWRKEYVCGKLSSGDVANYFNYYTPGNHWLHLRLKLPRESVIPMADDFSTFAAEKFCSLVPVYRFIEWRPDNDFVFGNSS